MANAKRCDSCETYFTPWPYGIINIGPRVDQSGKSRGQLRVKLVFSAKEESSPITSRLDLCPKCICEALKQVMISLAQEIR